MVAELSKAVIYDYVTIAVLCSELTGKAGTRGGGGRETASVA
jgi:hypothetical protein